MPPCCASSRRAARPGNAEAVFLTPSHQFPIGGVLSADRRQRLVHWLRERDALALEDDYDAEFRYDQAPVGALQGLAPDRIVYAGTASKTLAPALRLGWLVVPPALVAPMHGELRRWSEGPPRIDQDALAELLRSGAYDRHLRRMRRLYRDRRHRLLSRLATLLPGLEVEGAAAGLHITLRLPDDVDEAGEAAILAALRRRGLATEGLGRYSATATGPRRLFLGYGRLAEKPASSRAPGCWPRQFWHSAARRGPDPSDPARRAIQARRQLFQVVLADHDRRLIAVACQCRQPGFGNAILEAVELVDRVIFRRIAAQRLDHRILHGELIFVAIDLGHELDQLLVLVVEDAGVDDVHLVCGHDVRFRSLRASLA
jgi:hypothetical protein